MNIKVNDNTPEFLSWLAGVTAISHNYTKAHYSSLALDPFTVHFGVRYVRVMRGGSAHAFIDRTNGDVLKPATWKAPTKHARGNIYDANNGLASMGPYGPAYLR